MYDRTMAGAALFLSFFLISIYLFLAVMALSCSTQDLSLWCPGARPRGLYSYGPGAL